MELTNPKFILRAVETLFAIVAFGTAAQWVSNKPASIGFTIFTGVMGFLFCLFFIFAYLKPSFNAKVVGLPEFVISAVWSLFFFAAGIAVAVDANGYCDSGKSGCSNIRASAAFSFLSCVLWIGSTFFSFRDWKSPRAAHV